MSVLETVQETLFQQFLAGSDPSRRLAETQGTQGTQDTTRVEDLAWWKYQRALALWYCEWLDTYYDSGERRFLWRDELTQGFEAANLAEVKDLAQRMRLELPEHDAEEMKPDESSDVHAEAKLQEIPGDSSAVEDDGDWHVAALAAAVDDDSLELWQPDGEGNLTHWAAEVGRLFLWQEHSGVLYEYVPATDTSFARWVARWALQPRLVLSVSAELRVVDGHGVTLGSEVEEPPCWQFSSLQPQHARVFRKGKRWWIEALDDASPSLLNGQRLQLGEPMALLSSALLRLGDVELQLDLPETPGAASATAEATATSAATAPVLQRDFVRREEEPSPQPTGTARAYALNRALRRLVCGSNTQSKALERPDVLAREQRYEDRAEKRRRLHPVEWPQPTAVPATAPPLPTLPASPVEAQKLEMSRRFTEKPGL